MEDEDCFMHYLTEPDLEQSMMMSLSDDELKAYADSLASNFGYTTSEEGKED